MGRHVDAGRAAHAALRWLGRDRTTRGITYGDLSALTGRFANVLASLCAARGERVFSLLCRVPGLCIAALGTLKAGYVFLPWFPPSARNRWPRSTARSRVFARQKCRSPIQSTSRTRHCPAWKKLPPPRGKPWDFGGHLSHAVAGRRQGSGNSCGMAPPARRTPRAHRRTHLPVSPPIISLGTAQAIQGGVAASPAARNSPPSRGSPSRRYQAADRMARCFSWTPITCQLITSPTRHRRRKTAFDKPGVQAAGES